MTQERTELAPARAKTSLREICRRIDVAYRSEKTMYDPPLVSLVEELSTRTSEIVDVLDLLRDLDGYNHFDLTHVEVDDRYAELKNRAREVAAANKPPVRQLFRFDRLPGGNHGPHRRPGGVQPAGWRLRLPHGAGNASATPTNRP